MSISISTLADRLRQRDVRRVVYFHCDHFEPWRSPHGGVSEENAAHIVRFAEDTMALPDAQRLTLFYRPHISPTMQPRSGAVFAEDTPLGFVVPSEKSIAIGQQGIGRLVRESTHEIQVHIHHEYITRNEKYCLQSKWGADFFNQTTTPEMDRKRFALLVELSLGTLRKETGLALPNWFFVHGNWGLHGGDPNVCSITNEIQTLQRFGCLGDFTFPAEPPHGAANPSYDHPMMVLPNHQVKCYDLPEADACQAFGFSPGAQPDASRFFIWAASLDFPSSLDYFAEPVAKRCEAPLVWAEDIIRLAPVQGDTLYVKTYAHSMNMRYTQGETTVFPHAYDPIRRMLGALWDAAGAAGASVEFLTAAEVYRDILDARMAASSSKKVSA